MLTRPRTTGIGLALLAATYLSGCSDRGATGPATVARVEVSPQTATLTALGDTQDFNAVAKDADGNTISGQTFTWTSSATGVATVDTTGLATASGPGEATIRARAAAISGDAVLRVQFLTFNAITTGDFLACALTTGASAYCWGDDHRGQLGGGEGVRTIKPVPTPVAGGLSFASVSAGDEHTCGVTTGGVAYCWGDNAKGQIGGAVAGNFYTTTPAAVAGGLSFASVSAGGGHTCGVTTGGVAYCWGWNYDGQLGDGTQTFRTVPVEVSGGLNFASVNAGDEHTCGVTTGGVAHCWGDNFYGQLGDDLRAGYLSTTPVRVLH